MASLTITVRSENDVRFCACAGRLDIASAAVLDAEVDGLLAGGAKRIVLDLAGVDYVSSAGLRSLLVAVKKAAVNRAKIATCGVTPAVGEILEISGLKGLMNVQPDALTAATATA